MKLPIQLNWKTKHRIKGEENASKHINVLAHYDNETLIDKSGKLIKIFKLSGNFIQDELLRDIHLLRKNHFFKNFSSEFAFYIYQVKRKSTVYPGGEFQNSFANQVNEAYKKQIATRPMFHTEHYFALMTKPPEGMINKGFSFVKQFVSLFDKQAKRDYLKKCHRELNSATLTTLNALRDYGVKLLQTYTCGVSLGAGLLCFARNDEQETSLRAKQSNPAPNETPQTYEHNETIFSEPLSFISQLINFDTFDVQLKITDASVMLPRKRLFFNDRSGTIEMRAADGSKKFASVVSIKAYAPTTDHALLDGLMSLPFEYVITQSFRFYDKQDAKRRLRDQQFDLIQAQDESITQTDEIDDVLDDTASGDVGYGKHHFTLVCYADTQNELGQYVAQVVSRFADIDITAVREDIACELGFWAQLPGNFSYICRPADISTKNMAAFASFHNPPLGKLRGNYWGDAVTVFETQTGSPYYFNFHYKDVGNFLVFGAMGSGKSVLIGFLILQSMKFGGKRIIFDKDRGLEILVRAMGGVYTRLKPGVQTGFNPCHLENTADNRKFLAMLFKKMLTLNSETLDENETALIEKAIDGLYRMERSARQLCHIAPYFGSHKQISLRARFDQWHSGGAYAWLFDHANDTLDLEGDVLGFDIGTLLADKECKTPALMYLTYRALQALEGDCGMVFFDEGWKALEDDFLKAFVNDNSRTFRKKNNICGMATQVASDVLLNKAIYESAFCKIFFPSPGADRSVYVDGLGVPEHEYNVIKTLPDDQQYFLLLHGSSTNQESVVLRLNLSGNPGLIHIISAREQSLAVFDEVCAEVGDRNDDWLPLFLERMERGTQR